MTTVAVVIREQQYVFMGGLVYMTSQHLFEILRAHCFSLLLELNFYMCVVLLFIFSPDIEL